jgi:hypothetical protein
MTNKLRLSPWALGLMMGRFHLCCNAQIVGETASAGDNAFFAREIPRCGV